MQLFSDNFSYLYKFDCNLYDPKIFVSYCLHFMHVFFFFLSFFQFQFSLKLQYYIFRRKIGLIDWKFACSTFSNFQLYHRNQVYWWKNKLRNIRNCIVKIWAYKMIRYYLFTNANLIMVWQPEIKNSKSFTKCRTSNLRHFVYR
jgi:hypothetical protein